LKQYQQAEEFLSIASWTIMKIPDAPAHIKAELHLNFGLLYVSKGNIDLATENLATSVYYLALLHGTDHLVTSFGYFNLGNVFVTQGKMDKAIDFLRKVIDIWYQQLIKSVDKESEESEMEKSEPEKEIPSEPEKKQGFLRKKFDIRKPLENSLESLDEEKIFEANRMFEHILNIEMDRYGETHIETGKVFMVYGLYQFWIGEVVKSKEYLEKAQAVFKYVLGDKHSSTREIKELIIKM
jgi:tetratricopeptide (TPR) repeat protein